MSARLLRPNAPMRQLEAAASSSLFRLTARSFLPPSSASSSFVSVYARSFSSSPASIRTLSTLSSTLFPSRQSPSVSLARPPAPSRRSQSSSTSSSSRPSAVEDDSPDKLPLGQRLKALMKKYGWWAVGVYGVLSLFDFGVAFALVQYLGVERIKQAEKSIKVWAKESTGWTWGEQEVVAASKEQLEEGRKEIKKKGYDSSFWAQVAIAYGIHKTLFLPFRLGATTAILPRFVALLTRHGWAGRGAKGMKEKVQQKVQQVKDRRS